VEAPEKSRERNARRQKKATEYTGILPRRTASIMSDFLSAIDIVHQLSLSFT
jgi:hypothetical protein